MKADALDKRTLEERADAALAASEFERGKRTLKTRARLAEWRTNLQFANHALRDVRWIEHVLRKRSARHD